MTHPNTRAAQCQGKDKFIGYAAATRVAKRQKHKGVAAYKCPICKSWHVGTSPKKAGAWA